MRAPRSVTVLTALTALALLGLGSAGCATLVRAHGEIDPAATISASPTASETDSPTPDPTTSSPTPTPTLDPTAERRITCLLITPSVSKAITDWNKYVDKKGGTRTTVATSLTASAALVESVLRSARIAPNDQIRVWGNRLALEMRTMAAALRRGATPGVQRFNDYKRRLQAACPKG
jgi:hypothetical protein